MKQTLEINPFNHEIDWEQGNVNEKISLQDDVKYQKEEVLRLNNVLADFKTKFSRIEWELDSQCQN